MIKENCVCGATFEVSYADRNEENDVWARCAERDRYSEFLEAHKICRNSYVEIQRQNIKQGNTPVIIEDK